MFTNKTALVHLETKAYTMFGHANFEGQNNEDKELMNEGTQRNKQNLRTHTNGKCSTPDSNHIFHFCARQSSSLHTVDRMPHRVCHTLLRD
jgi:hypothetical protein